MGGPQRSQTLGDDGALLHDLELGHFRGGLGVRARDAGSAAGAGHGAVECGLGPIDLALRAPAGARRAVAAEGRVALRDLEARKLLLHLRFAPGERRQALLEPGGLLLRLGLDGLQPLCLSFELELAGHRRFGQIVPALAKRKSRLLIETGEPLAGQAFLAHGLEAARRRGLVLGTDFVDSAVDCDVPLLAEDAVRILATALLMTAMLV